jgi:Cu-processing system permease protein
MGRITKYVIVDLLRNRIVISYTLVLLAIGLALFNLDSNPVKGILGLLNVVLLIVPMVSIIFGTIYYYNSSEFIELLLTMPLKRSKIILSVYKGLAVSLSASVLIGLGLPIMIYSPNMVGLVLLIAALVLTCVFLSLALLASVLTRDKSRGIGFVILQWLYFALIYDGILLFVLFEFNEYPMENWLVGLSALNPIDMARIFILLHLDISAIMGYTGAIFREFLGAFTGMLFAAGVMLLWIVLPLALTVRKFRKKDF